MTSPPRPNGVDNPDCRRVEYRAPQPRSDRMMTGGPAMSSGTLILDVRRAQAEAARRALSSWQPPEDPGRRAATVEGLIRRLLGLPRELRDVVGDVLDNMPKDGTLLDYMNLHRTELHGLFDSALAELRQA